MGELKHISSTQNPEIRQLEHWNRKSRDRRRAGRFVLEGLRELSLAMEGDKCCLAVADQGRGIEAFEQKKIFNMFYRIRRKDENIRGTGLGLFIVHATVRRHHGQVKVESSGAKRIKAEFFTKDKATDAFKIETSEE